MNVVDGKKIAADIFAEIAVKVKELNKVPTLTAVTCAPNFETQRYLEMKKARATEVGIQLRVIELPETATTEDIVACIEVVASDSDGIVLQLPLPAHIDREAVLQSIPVELDPDGFSYGVHDEACLSPVVGAIKEISERNNINFSNTKTVVLGQGRLVGLPAIHWLRTTGADVSVLTEDATNHSEVLAEADVIVSGIGQPHFITSEMVKEGVIIFDAGTSEDGGVLVGDVHPDVAHKAALFTPVPGGIGPITIAVLLRNLVYLIS